MSWRTHFLDVSMWQGTIRWDEVPFPAIVKATEGVGYIDPEWARNAAEAGAAGKLMGGYHFLSRTTRGEAQADHFIATITPYLGRRRVWVLDWETDRGALPDESIANAFLGRWRDHNIGEALWLYGNAPRRWWAQREGLPFWCAWYPPAHEADRVREHLRAMGDTAWQWTSAGEIPGIDTAVDLNEFLIDLPHLTTQTMEGQTMTNEEVQRLATAILDAPVGELLHDDGTWRAVDDNGVPYTIRNAIRFGHAEAKMGKQAANTAGTIAARVASVVSAPPAAPGPVASADLIAEAVLSALVRRLGGGR